PPRPAAERPASTVLLGGAVDLDELLERPVRLLAQLTQHVDVVQYPSMRRSALRHVEFVPTGPNRIMVVIITANGRVAQRLVDSVQEVDELLLAELRARVNAEVAGRSASEVRKRFEQVADAFPPVDR